MLTASEQRVLRTFREFRVAPGQMLCFDGPTLKKHNAAVRQLIDKDLLVRESFQGGFSLTPAGFEVMQQSA